jgi:hypothetical protein
MILRLRGEVAIVPGTFEPLNTEPLQGLVASGEKKYSAQSTADLNWPWHGEKRRELKQKSPPTWQSKGLHEKPSRGEKTGLLPCRPPRPPRRNFKIQRHAIDSANSAEKALIHA